jgi:hypothetical protein
MSGKTLYCLLRIPRSSIIRRAKVVWLTVYDGAFGIGEISSILKRTAKGVFLDLGENFGKYGIIHEESLKN